jgi:hypothetical protein
MDANVFVTLDAMSNVAFATPVLQLQSTYADWTEISHMLLTFSSDTTGYPAPYLCKILPVSVTV